MGEHVDRHAVVVIAVPSPVSCSCSFPFHCPVGGGHAVAVARRPLDKFDVAAVRVRDQGCRRAVLAFPRRDGRLDPIAGQQEPPDSAARLGRIT